MADNDPNTTPNSSTKEKSADQSKVKSTARRSIPGDFSYTTTPGKLKSALEKMVDSERPDVFTKDYVSTYLGVSGGSAAPIPQILRRVGFLSNDNKPTELYAKFQNPSERGQAALEGVKRGFAELFKRHTHAHALPEDQVKGCLVEITGLTKGDQIISQIYGTFDAFRSFIPKGMVSGLDGGKADRKDDEPAELAGKKERNIRDLGLSYHINIVLPETKGHFCV